MKRRCIFLDRDGVINRSPAPGDYIRRVDELTLIPETVDWIRLFNALGLLVIVVTNQRGIARGLMTEEDLTLLQRHLEQQLSIRGARVDAFYYCPHEEGVCGCRKPQPGLVAQAQADWNIDLSESIMIGDTDRDRDLARVCGMGFVRVLEGRVLSWEGATVSGGPYGL